MKSCTLKARVDNRGLTVMTGGSHNNTKRKQKKKSWLMVTKRVWKIKTLTSRGFAILPRHVRPSRTCCEKWMQVSLLSMLVSYSVSAEENENFILSFKRKHNILRTNCIRFVKYSFRPLEKKKKINNFLPPCSIRPLFVSMTRGFEWKIRQ